MIRSSSICVSFLYNYLLIKFKTWLYDIFYICLMIKNFIFFNNSSQLEPLF